MLHHLGEHMEGAFELAIEQESLDDGVAYANCGVLNALKDSASVVEASLMWVLGAESQNPAQCKGVVVKPSGEYLGMGLLKVAHVLAFFQ